MKLLIDIPEYIYEHAKESSEDSRDEFDAMRAIANGTPQQRTGAEVLDKIRAEIESVIQEETVVDNSGVIYGGEFVVSKLDPDDVFQIIDKYKAESEDKE